MDLNAIVTAIAATLPTGTPVRVYVKPHDHAGLGFPHRMIAWVDADGYPRSMIIPA